MNHLVKRFLSFFLSPLIRAVYPVLEQIQRLFAYIVLAARVSPPVDPTVVILGPPEVHGTGRVSLGRNLRLYTNVYFETQDSGSIEIGDDVVISRGAQIVAHASVKIGAGSMIGEFTSIRDGNHRRNPSGDIRETGHESAPITIGKQVWIGRGVMILPGVQIGDRATVAANAVVSHDVPSGSCVAGVPARIIAKPAASRGVSSGADSNSELLYIRNGKNHS
jgi:acetyltransferase-like isoleucine patch superfamily enzyme